MFIKDSQPKPPKKSFSRNLVTNVSGIAYAVLIVLGMMAAAFFHPLRAYETTIYIILLTCPMWALAIMLYSKVLNATIFVNQQKPPVLLFGASLCIYVVIAAAVALNGWLDKSEEMSCTKNITGKDYHSTKHSINYYVEIEPCTPPQFSLLSLDRAEEISVTASEYDLVVLNQDQATLVYKKGYFGIPWKIRGYMGTPHAEDTHPSP
jgi:hypothetical protein